MTQFRRLLILILALAVSLPAQWYYKVADIFRNPTEYRAPLKMTLFEVRTGFQTFGIGTQPLYFDSTESNYDNFNPFYARTLHSVELDLFKFNWPVYILPQNLFDFQTGIGGKYSYSLIKYPLPSAWPQYMPNSSDPLYLSPRVYEFNVNQSMIFQWAPAIYNYFTFSYGLAYGSAYKTHFDDHFLYQKGRTYSFALGVKFLGSVGYKIKEGYGVELRYTYGDFGDLRDPHHISPVSKVNFNTLGISLAFNSNMGGGRTEGDEAKKLYYSGDYMAAKATFNEFLTKYPRHPKAYKARAMIKECDKRIPYQEIVLAESFIEARNYSKAAEYLASAGVTRNLTLRGRISENYDKITNWFRDTMDSLITLNQIDQAEYILNETIKLNLPDTGDLYNRYRSEIYFHRGAVFMEYGMWEKAIEYFDAAIGQYPLIRKRVDPYLMEIANGYINDANLSVDKKSIALALESLTKATTLRPDIRNLTVPYIKNLEEGIKMLRQEAAKQKTRESIGLTFNPPPQNPAPEPGMTSAQIQKLLGEPTTRTRLEAAGGHTYELWIYAYKDKTDRQVYFDNDLMVKMENVPAAGIATETEE